MQRVVKRRDRVDRAGSNVGRLLLNSVGACELLLNLKGKELTKIKKCCSEVVARSKDAPVKRHSANGIAPFLLDLAKQCEETVYFHVPK